MDALHPLLCPQTRANKAECSTQKHKQRERRQEKRKILASVGVRVLSKTQWQENKGRILVFDGALIMIYINDLALFVQRQILRLALTQWEE